MTEVGVLTLNENPSFLAPFTKAPSSVKRNEKRYQSTLIGTVSRHLHALYSYRPQLLTNPHARNRPVIVKRRLGCLFYLVMQLDRWSCQDCLDLSLVQLCDTQLTKLETPESLMLLAAITQQE